jgi:hypothetical protein
MLHGSSARVKNDKKKGTTGEAGQAVPNRYIDSSEDARWAGGVHLGSGYDWPGRKKRLEQGKAWDFPTLVRVSAQRLTTKGLCLEKTP